jgi:phosphoribosylformylglycinamidine synthase
VALAECSGSGLGAAVNVGTPLAATRALFAESAGRALVSLPPGRERNLVDAARRHGVAVSLLGRVGGDRLVLTVNGAPAVDLPVSRLLAASENAFARLMEVHT